jgi:hypothetical protein
MWEGMKIKNGLNKYGKRETRKGKRPHRTIPESLILATLRKAYLFKKMGG